MKYRGFERVERLMNIGYLVGFPKRNDKGSCAYDFYYPYSESTIIQPNETKIIATGIKAYMLQDEVLELNTRSGNGCKKNIVLANVIGYVDSSYYNNEDNEGEILVALRNEGTEPFEIKSGDKFAQGKFSKYLIADDDFVVNEIRKGGLGHSGS